jgi:putative CocE/NonD family hydrolase
MKKTIFKIISSLVIIILVISACTLNLSKQNLRKITENGNTYLVQDSILIKTKDGAYISAMMVRKFDVKIPQTTILQYTIYVRDSGRDIKELKEIANKGYVAVIAYTRGKRTSPNEIFPYEHVSNDTYDVIDWISKQKWSNQKVGMFGGSYNGFSQWAATKKMHPALKTIVPYVANRPGKGLPFENNIFITPNYSWSLLVGNNKYLDTKAGNDRQRFRNMQNAWWESGVAFKKIDSIDKAPNKLFQRWIKHPSFDSYWQKMTPHKEEFAHINIPILTIDGYYNDSQNSSLSYVRDHYEYNSNPNHYLVIGPYSHFGAQRKGNETLYGYKVDANALIDTKQITFDWFNYIFKNGKKPNILKDKINYQVMGTNEWGSSATIKNMSNENLKFYLSNIKEKDFYKLNVQKPLKNTYLYQEVDFKDRESNTNNDYYPEPIIREELDTSNGYFFISDFFKSSVKVNGSFNGELKISINKRDVDIGVTLYEVLPNGNYFHLSYYIGRASYAKDISSRKLLTPNEKTTIPFTNSHLVSKQLKKGSRLLVVVNINKNQFSPLNYGSGKDVMNETITDAKEPLQIKWFSDSFIKIPIKR